MAHLQPLERLHSSDRAFRLAFLVCSAAALGAIWSVRYLPMVDLPQHAAQLGAFLDRFDPAYPFREVFRVRWFTPYWGSYGVVLFFTLFLPLRLAIHAALSVAIVGLPLAVRRLLGVTGSDRWLSLLAFPLSFGFAFQFGLLNFVMAAPLGVLFVAEAIRFHRSPTRRRGLILGLFATALFFSHLLLLAFCLLVGGFLSLTHIPRWRRVLATGVPLLFPLPLVALWLWMAGSGTAHGDFPDLWAWGWVRPAFWFGFMSLSPRFGTGQIYGLVVSTLPLLLGFRPSRDTLRWAPFGAVLLVFAAAPSSILNVGLIYPRFNLFFAPFLHAALDPGPRARKRLIPALVLLVVLPWLGVINLANRAFDAECAELDGVLELMEPQRQAVGLVFSRHSRTYPMVPHMSTLGAWYMAEKQGIYDSSFASLSFAILPYREPIHGAGGRRYVHQEQSFDWESHRTYDYVLVATDGDPSPLMVNAPESCRLAGRSGRWWLYDCGEDGEP